MAANHPAAGVAVVMAVDQEEGREAAYEHQLEGPHAAPSWVEGVLAPLPLA